MLVEPAIEEVGRPRYWRIDLRCHQSLGQRLVLFLCIIHCSLVKSLKSRREKQRAAMVIRLGGFGPDAGVWIPKVSRQVPVDNNAEGRPVRQTSRRIGRKISEKNRETGSIDRNSKKIVMKSRLSEDPNSDRCCLSTGSSSGLQPILELNGRPSGIANGVLARLPVGNFFMESVSWIWGHRSPGICVQYKLW